jgi:hypothetical protein
MDSPDLLVICLSSFMAVFVILIALALTMRLIISVFPAKEQAAATGDSALVAAINTVYNSQFPGNNVIKIEELK